MKVVGWIFIAISLLGCLLFLSYMANWDMSNDDIMASRSEGGASNAPIMIGLLAIAGAYLIKTPGNGSQ